MCEDECNCIYTSVGEVDVIVTEEDEADVEQG